jgi:hypothetical protein
MRSVNRLITIISQVLLSLLCLTACSRPTPPLKWTEDVQIPNGPIVTLTRYQEFKGPHEIGDGPTSTDYWFEFKHPESQQTIRWQRDRDLATLVLMIDKGIPFLLVTP